MFNSSILRGNKIREICEILKYTLLEHSLGKQVNQEGVLSY